MCHLVEFDGNAENVNRLNRFDSIRNFQTDNISFFFMDRRQ